MFKKQGFVYIGLTSYTPVVSMEPIGGLNT